MSKLIFAFFSLIVGSQKKGVRYKVALYKKKRGSRAMSSLRANKAAPSITYLPPPTYGQRVA